MDLCSDGASHNTGAAPHCLLSVLCRRVIDRTLISSLFQLVVYSVGRAHTVLVGTGFIQISE